MLLDIDHYDRKNGIYGFVGKYHFLSNFHPCEFGEYKSSEHYYMSFKPEIEDAEYYKARQSILDAPTAAKAKKIARNVKLRSDWRHIKLAVMHEALKKKFAIPDLQEKLLSTDNRYLEETNTWGDIYWGVCEGVGENHLGRLLMEIREYYDTKVI